MRLRPESFADHYSQARQFFISQTPPEQRHIAMALTFELSKVETPEIRERMVSHLLNIDETLATTVADKLGFQIDAEAGGCGRADPPGSRAVAGAQHRRARAETLRRPQARHSGDRWRRREAVEGT